MTLQAHPTSDAASARRAGDFVGPALALATIDRWSVVGHDRIVGFLRDGTSRRNGKKIITSPVLRMRVAESGERIAHTQSGSRYVLATPATGFGAERAEQFVRMKCGVPSSRDLPPADSGMHTALLKLQA